MPRSRYGRNHTKLDPSKNRYGMIEPHRVAMQSPEYIRQERRLEAYREAPNRQNLTMLILGYMTDRRG